MNTKRDIAIEAMQDIGYDEPGSREVLIAVRELRNMCLSLENSGVYIGFNNTGDNLPTDESGIPAINRDAAVKNLAVRMADIFDVVLSAGYLNRAAMLLQGITPFVIPECQADSMLPNGSGDRLYSSGFFSDEYQLPDDIRYTNTGEKVAAERDLHDVRMAGNIVSTEWLCQSSTVEITETNLIGSVATAMVAFSAVGTYTVKILATYDTGEIDSKCIAFQVDECREPQLVPL